jgi:hypothetical protein
MGTPTLPHQPRVFFYPFDFSKSQKSKKKKKYIYIGPPYPATGAQNILSTTRPYKGPNVLEFRRRKKQLNRSSRTSRSQTRPASSHGFNLPPAAMASRNRYHAYLALPPPIARAPLPPGRLTPSATSPCQRHSSRHPAAPASPTPVLPTSLCHCAPPWAPAPPDLPQIPTTTANTHRGQLIPP